MISKLHVLPPFIAPIKKTINPIVDIVNKGLVTNTDDIIAERLPDGRVALKLSDSPRFTTTALVPRATSKLVIAPTFDSSVTSDPDAAAIKACMYAAIDSIRGTLNNDVTVNIYVYYNNDFPGALGANIATINQTAWATFIAALTAHSSTTNDATAVASLPGSSLATDINFTSANGRALGLSSPPGLDSAGGAGSTYDSVIWLTSSQPWAFTRPAGSTKYDAQSVLEHEIDEGLGIWNDSAGTDFYAIDLFAWSAPGTRNLTTTGTRYFSIDGGTTNIKEWNQDFAAGDTNDWVVAGDTCPAAVPNVQDYFGCQGQSPPGVNASTPEGVLLDVIGWTLL